MPKLLRTPGVARGDKCTATPSNGMNGAGGKRKGGGGLGCIYGSRKGKGGVGLYLRETSEG